MTQQVVFVPSTNSLFKIQSFSRTGYFVSCSPSSSEHSWKDPVFCSFLSGIQKAINQQRRIYDYYPLFSNFCLSSGIASLSSSCQRRESWPISWLSQNKWCLYFRYESFGWFVYTFPNRKWSWISKMIIILWTILTDMGRVTVELSKCCIYFIVNCWLITNNLHNMSMPHKKKQGPA